MPPRLLIAGNDSRIVSKIIFSFSARLMILRTLRIRRTRPIVIYALKSTPTSGSYEIISTIMVPTTTMKSNTFHLLSK